MASASSSEHSRQRRTASSLSPRRSLPVPFPTPRAGAALLGATGGAEQFNWEQLAADIETGALTPCVTNPSLREAVAGILCLGSKRERRERRNKEM